MKKIAFALLASTLLASAAQAADLPAHVYTKAPAAVVPLAYDWSGVYIGVQGGGIWSHLDADYTTGGVFGHRNIDGTLLGGTLGVNWQRGNFVFGVEGDYAWADAKGSNPCPSVAFDCRSKLDSFGTARARLGWAYNTALFYVTGGAAFGDQHIETVNLAGAAIPPSGGPVNGSSHFNTGWTAGGGLEWGLTPNISVKAEALYFDLGRDTYPVDTGLFVRAREDGFILRGGLNYRFNWGGPVAGAY
jgi:outer membrane immunogenic protein